MKLLLSALISMLSANAFSDPCTTIAKYDNLSSMIYVVCPDLPNKTDNEINHIVKGIFASREFVPDEYTIDFVSSSESLTQDSLTETSHIGWYYTHDNKITIWPKSDKNKRVVQLWY